MELVVGRPLHPVVRRLGLAQHLVEIRGPDLLRPLHGRPLDGPRHMAQLPLQAAERLGEQADPLVEAGDGAWPKPEGGRK